MTEETKATESQPEPKAQPADQPTPAATPPGGETPAGVPSDTKGSAPETAEDAESGKAPRRRLRLTREVACTLCRSGVERVDYKDTELLRAFCRTRGRIQSRKRARSCALHQRLVKVAIKRARFMALLSYTEDERRMRTPRR